MMDIEGRERRKKGKKKQKMPFQNMLIIPFLVQSIMIPMMMTMMKMMLVKSAIIGTIGIILGLVNFFSRSSGDKVHNHNIKLVSPPADHHGMPTELMEQHYGYNGGTEYGAWLNGISQYG